MHTSSANPTFFQTRSIRIVYWLIGLAALIMGLFLVFRPGYVPGDVGDARFNMYILEHGYRWLLRLDTSFWNAPIFYPASNTVALSDNHLGTFLIYSLFRSLGANRELAFLLWGIVLSILNFTITWLALRKFNVHPIAAIAGAYLFSFGYVVIGQIGHIQLMPRFMVPIAFWMATSFIETGDVKHFAFFLAACAFQFYLGFYMGYFLGLILAPYCLALIVIRRSWRPFIDNLRSCDRRMLIFRAIGYATCCIGFVIVLIPLAIPYLKALESVGGRPWSVIVPQLPRLGSYLFAPLSNVWTGMNQGQFGEFAVEHQLFLGLIPLLSLLILPFVIQKDEAHRKLYEIGIPMAFAIFAVFIITLYYKGHSLYYFVWYCFPGARGIRAVTRAIIVLLFPISFVLAGSLTFFLEKIVKRFNHMIATTAGCILLGLLAVDQSTKDRSFSFEYNQKRIADLREKIQQVATGVPNGKVLWAHSAAAEPFYVTQIDAMLASQEMGLSSINGYSGNAPKNYPASLMFLDENACAAMSQWVHGHSGKITKDNLIEVGADCPVFEH